MAVLRKYQTFWPRFWAGWLDGFAFAPIALLDWGVRSVTSAPVILGIWYVLFSISYDLYAVAMHAKYGQTLGKMYMGIKVLDLSETKLTFRQAVLRDLVPIALACTGICIGLPRVLAGFDPDKGHVELWLVELFSYGSLIWFAAELSTMLTNSKRRAVHDFIAGSVVVRVADPEDDTTQDAPVA